MDILEYEQAILAACLIEPGVIRRIAIQLAEDKFTEGITRDIYSAILDLHQSGTPVNAMSVITKIGDGEKEQAVRGLLPFFAERQIFDLRGLDSWIVAVDNAGRLRQIGLVTTEYAAYFKNFKGLLAQVTDVDEFVTDFISKIRVSQGAVKTGYLSIADVAEDFKRRFRLELEGQQPERIPTFWPKFNAMTAGGIPKGYLVVVCGLPGTGKTQLILQLLEQMARRTTGCVAFNSLEMARHKLLKRLAFAYAKVDSREVSAGKIAVGSAEAWRVEREIERLSQLPFYIDDSDFATSSTIDYQASALHAEKGPLQALGIDYAELVKEKEEDKAASEELRVSSIFRRAKSIAKTLDTTVFLAAQYSRGVTLSNSKLGDNFHIRYSGAAEAVADVILHVYNPKQLKDMGTEVRPPEDMPIRDGRAYIVVGKDKDCGTSIIPMGWQSKYVLWEDEGIQSAVLGTKPTRQENHHPPVHESADDEF